MIPLFHPYVPDLAKRAVLEVLSTRWIGQGPKVVEFEKLWEEKISTPHKAVAVGSGTDALHLAYILAGIKEGDEVIAPIFTCTATNIPLLYQKAKIIFADVKKDNFNIDPEDVKRKITDKTKAIVVVHYGGLPVDLDEIQAIADEYSIPVIEDAAQAHGAVYKGKIIGSISDFTCFSFQAIKLITTGDGGMLTIKDSLLVDKAKRLRWFGIDREAKLGDVWNNEVTELGYKYQMTDIAATMGIEALKQFGFTLECQRTLFKAYQSCLRDVPGITVIGDDEDHQSSAWLCTVIVDRKDDLKKKLREKGIECGEVHYRNDKYAIFGERVKDCPNMDALEDKYLILPMYSLMSLEQVDMICNVIKEGW